VISRPTQSRNQRRLRIIYTAGPGDIGGTFRFWRQGQDDPGQVAMTYSAQFYDVCRETGALGYAISSHPRHELIVDDSLRVEHRRIPFIHRGGALYHLGQVWMALWLTTTAIRFRANVVVVGEGTCHWFPLRLLRHIGIAVVPTVHCVFWSQAGRRSSLIPRLIARLNRPFWRRSAMSILSASHVISRQLDEVAGGTARPVIDFLPTYRPETFADIPPPAPKGSSFRVLFAGRVETNKGVFVLLEIARRLKAAGRTDIEFDLCGNGSAIDELRRGALEAGLTRQFRVHGHCDRATMRQIFRLCDIVIVPTTKDFVEGFNQVVVEGVLAGRPVVTSNVCPALEYVRAAIVEVPPDDVDAYEKAILALAEKGPLYDEKRAACPQLQGQFYDPSRGWAAALVRALDPLRQTASQKRSI
jgi:glycogen(starch) synthase